GAVADLARAAEHAPQIARNVESSTTNLPSLLTQTELTAQQLSQLLVQLRELWLLGGSGKLLPPAPTRLPASEVRPGREKPLSCCWRSPPAAARRRRRRPRRSTSDCSSRFRPARRPIHWSAATKLPSATARRCSAPRRATT